MAGFLAVEVTCSPSILLKRRFCTAGRRELLTYSCIGRWEVSRNDFFHILVEGAFVAVETTCSPSMLLKKMFCTVGRRELLTYSCISR